MSRRGKDINKDTEGLWAYVTADISPLPGRKRLARPATPHEDTPVRAERTKPPLKKPPAPTPKSDQARDLDRRTEQKLARGQMEIDAVIDLHGHGQGVARESLFRFLQEAHRRGYRCVLAITGKGKDGTGILRQRIPEWVEEAPLRDIVLRAVHARPADGGKGAYYILLRRIRG